MAPAFSSIDARFIFFGSSDALEEVPEEPEELPLLLDLLDRELLPDDDPE